MRTLTYYVAATLDGFIAAPDGGNDFFPIEADVMAAMNAAQPETVPTHVREQFGLADVPNKRFDTVVMGRRTYDPALQVGITSPYAHLRQVVFSRTLTSTDPSVEVVDTDPVAFVAELKRGDGKSIWLAGGGKLASALIGEIDELVVKRYPLVIGAGIGMFDGALDPARFRPSTSQAFASGAVVSTYVRA